MIKNLMKLINSTDTKSFVLYDADNNSVIYEGCKIEREYEDEDENNIFFIDGYIAAMKDCGFQVNYQEIKISSNDKLFKICNFKDYNSNCFDIEKLKTILINLKNMNY